ncbi:uncharacterized protein LOC109838216 [Asparagus officinalis]|uniref:uncharacterized protein LOC109838216 n=1 Tax=Asparagus officinalis TaxID=4686 RepID=UPI00098E6F77|nr:uncharacterized protein LOC109838216 [Asparagus officinalis]
MNARDLLVVQGAVVLLPYHGIHEILRLVARQKVDQLPRLPQAILEAPILLQIAQPRTSKALLRESFQLLQVTVHASDRAEGEPLHIFTQESRDDGIRDVVKGAGDELIQSLQGENLLSRRQQGVEVVRRRCRGCSAETSIDNIPSYRACREGAQRYKRPSSIYGSDKEDEDCKVKVEEQVTEKAEMDLDCLSGVDCNGWKGFSCCVVLLVSTASYAVWIFLQKNKSTAAKLNAITPSPRDLSFSLSLSLALKKKKPQVRAPNSRPLATPIELDQLRLPPNVGPRVPSLPSSSVNVTPPPKSTAAPKSELPQNRRRHFCNCPEPSKKSPKSSLISTADERPTSDRRPKLATIDIPSPPLSIAAGSSPRPPPFHRPKSPTSELAAPAQTRLRAQVRKLEFLIAFLVAVMAVCFQKLSLVTPSPKPQLMLKGLFNVRSYQIH